MNHVQRGSSRQALVWLGLLLLWNLVFFTFGLWKRAWLWGLLVDFAILVYLLQWLSTQLPAAKQPSFERGLAVSFPFLLLAAWELLVRGGVLNPLWFPPPSKIAGALWDLTVNYEPFTKTSLLGRPWLIPSVWRTQGLAGVKALFLESHVWVTIMRILAGFVLGAVPGLILGVIMGMNRTVRVMLDPVISATYVVPKITILPLMMLIFSPFGETYKIVTVAIAVFFIVLINSMTGVRDIDPIYIEAARNYGAGRWQLFHHVIIPGALPVIFAGLRLALGTALIVIVAVEFLRAKKGVGYITWYYWEVMVPAKMYAGLVVIMTLGILFTFGLQRLERWIMPWQREERPEAAEIAEG
ncbi:MAG TPA: ABC transporter permease [Anaerolineae bacterium]|nr:ABC transporter permease [Anaerolineae bacterium]HIQ05015.1 ABC transporter permease [Anaerolineae bacterium]